MLQLFMDTSTEMGFIGLGITGELVDVEIFPLGLQNSKLLFPSLLNLLERNSFNPKDIQLIGCGVGPGSYTGIRVAAGAAQSMAYGLRIPLVGITSLAAFHPVSCGSFAVAFDAKYGGVYSLKGTFDGTNVCFDAEPEVIALDKIQEAWQGLDVIVSPHAKELRMKISHPFKWEEGIPSGKIFAKEVNEQYRKGFFSNKAELKLLYLRKTQAEIEKERLSILK